MRGWWPLGLVLVSVSACSTPVPVAPPPLAAPSLSGAAPWAPELSTESVLVEPGPVVFDEILSSPMARDPEFQREVARWVDFWTRRDSRSFPEYLERMAAFSEIVDGALARHQLPPTLRYLPIVESGYSPRAVSRASAAGMWQFMAGTARGYGMSVGPLLDERRNPIKSTDAATRFLESLREQFGSWFLALAAYNSGPYRVQRVLDRHAPLAPRSDSLFWEIRHRLPRETQDFVPKLLGAAVVASNPALYGIEVPTDYDGFHFDEVVVPDATTLDVVADAAGASEAEIERLNPEVVRGITPPGRETILRVPPGRGLGFSRRYELIPPDERVTFVEHRVASGETLGHIALRYGIPLRDLQAANPGLNPRRLQIGQRLTVPVAPSARRRARDERAVGGP